MPWLATAYVRGPSLADAVSEHGPLPAASVLVLARGLAEAPERDPRRGRGAPRPEAGQRAAGRGRAAGDRFRHLPGGRGQRAHAYRAGGRLPRFHVAGAGRRPGGRAAQRYLQPGGGPGVRGDGPGTVRFRVDAGAGVPRGAQRASARPDAGRGPVAGRTVPGQGSGPASHRRRPAGRGGLSGRGLAARAGDPRAGGGPADDDRAPAGRDRGRARSSAAGSGFAAGSRFAADGGSRPIAPAGGGLAAGGR